MTSVLTPLMACAIVLAGVAAVGGADRNSSWLRAETSVMAFEALRTASVGRLLSDCAEVRARASESAVAMIAFSSGNSPARLQRIAVSDYAAMTPAAVNWLRTRAVAFFTRAAGAPSPRRSFSTPERFRPTLISSQANSDSPTFHSASRPSRRA